MDEVQLTVREKTSASDTAQDIAGLTFHTFVIFSDRTFAFQGTFSFIDNKNIQVRVLAQVMSSKESGGTAADNYNIVIFFLYAGLDYRHVFSLCGKVFYYIILAF
jgi:hypothetical protein